MLEWLQVNYFLCHQAPLHSQALAYRDRISGLTDRVWHNQSNLNLQNWLIHVKWMTTRAVGSTLYVVLGFVLSAARHVQLDEEAFQFCSALEVACPLDQPK